MWRGQCRVEIVKSIAHSEERGGNKKTVPQRKPGKAVRDVEGEAGRNTEKIRKRADSFKKYVLAKIPGSNR